ncbi:MAG: sensor domain-containing diguanylate cyclase [Devosia sp.]
MVAIAALAKPSFEEERLEKLAELDILDTPNEESFDRVARLISQIFGVEIGIVSMIDGHRQWYKAIEGLEARETKLSDTFCRYTMQGDEALIVPDATRDLRFADNPMVTGGPEVRFYAGVPLRTRDGYNLGTLCAIDSKPRDFGAKDVAILEDLARVVMRDLELSQQVAVDELTGALSRRAFKAEAHRHIALARRGDEPLSVLAFDLDHFKSINDQHGHSAGDDVLAAVGEACRAQLRTSDFLGRLGGEEFAILLPNTDLDGGIEVAGKLREAIAALSDNFNFKVSASLGVATRHGKFDEIEAILERADQAMYAAKRNGRDQVVSEARPTAPSAPRRRVLKGAKIKDTVRQSVIDCTVRSLGDDGATLSVSTPIGIPDDFVLSIPGDGFEAKCHVVGRSANALEVRFVAR